MRLLSVTCLLWLTFTLGSCTSRPRSDTEIKKWEIGNGVLSIGGAAVIENIPAGVRVSLSGNTGRGTFLRLLTDDIGTGIQRWSGFKLADAERITACCRMKPWWTRPAFIGSETEVPPETQALLWKRTDGRIGLMLPLLDRGYRLSLEGDSAGLSIIADNNMSAGGTGLTLTGAYVALGDNPYELLEEAFASVIARMGTGSLRAEKPLPGWIDHLGWASWYAFWREVTEEKFLAGIGSLEHAGVNLGYVLLDDGWESVNRERRLLVSFEPDAKKFPHGLKWLVDKVTRDYGVPYFLVWHTLEGYWSGIDSLSPEMAIYKTYPTNGRSNRPFPPRYEKYLKGRWNTFYPECAEAFFFDYHAYLSTKGVDGVKVDNQSDLGYMTYDLGPLTEVMAAYVRALESSAEHHYGPGNVLNCMSMVTDALYRYRRSSICRTSTDFFPDSASSWGPHLVLNAYNSLIWGNLIQPDWDMFKSVHPWAAFHAAARAISGGPVCLSDEPGKHDLGLIRKVALADSRILRPADCARPTADILFRDPQTEDVLLKIFNRNRAGSFILAAFNCNYLIEASQTITDTLAVALACGTCTDSVYAVLESGSREPVLRKADQSWRVSLSPGGFRIFTVSAVNRGVAPLGILDMFNSVGIFESCCWENTTTYKAALASGGEIAFYSEKKPVRVEDSSTGQEIEYIYNTDTRFLTVKPEGTGPRELSLVF